MTVDDWRQQQELEDEQRQFALLKALQEVYRAGLRKEALLLAFEGGVLTQFRKQIEKEQDHARHR